MNQSPLYRIHQSLSAKFTEVHGWEMPAHYGDPAAEHLAVRSNAGIMDMTHRGKVRVSGKDRTKFLQNILSQDINKLTPGNGGHAALLNTKGHMLAYMRIFSDEDSFLIDTEPGEADKIIQILNRYLFRENVKIEDVTLKHGLMTLQGPISRDIISSTCGTDIKEMTDCSHINITINGLSCKVVRTAYTGEEGYDIYMSWDDMQTAWETIRSTIISSKIPLSPPFSKGETFPPLVKGGEGGFEQGYSDRITPFGHAAYNSLRIEAGIPLYSIDMDEDTIPIEANLDHAISYTKGCYVGQETIARINFKGHVNRILTGFSIEGDIIPVKNDRIYTVTENTEHDIGVITSACFSPTLNKSIAIGYLRIGYNEPGAQVHIDSKPHKISAVVTVIPFYKISKPQGD